MPLRPAAENPRHCGDLLPTGLVSTHPGIGLHGRLRLHAEPIRRLRVRLHLLLRSLLRPKTELRDTWGDWVAVKENADAKLRNMRTDLRGKTIYMSSVTDPFQLIERRLGLVRELLELLAARGARSQTPTAHHQGRRMCMPTRLPTTSRRVRTAQLNTIEVS